MTLPPNLEKVREELAKEYVSNYDMTGFPSEYDFCTGFDSGIPEGVKLCIEILRGSSSRYNHFAVRAATYLESQMKEQGILK